jgi:hypothetical protein
MVIWGNYGGVCEYDVKGSVMGGDVGLRSHMDCGGRRRGEGGEQIIP